MRIDVPLLPAEAADYVSKTAIVIDVLRASSTMVTALSNECTSIRTVAGVESARNLKSENPEVLLCGERQGQKIAGFDLGNSPFEYSREVVKNKDLILTTTNGTQAIEAAQSADHILIGCFLNMKAVLESALKYKKDIIILCAGSDGRLSLEDTFCAGLMLEEFLEMDQSAKMEDGARFVSYATKQIINSTTGNTSADIYKFISESRHGKRLQSLNFQEDLKYCSQLNLLPVVPKLAGGKFII